MCIWNMYMKWIIHFFLILLDSWTEAIRLKERTTVIEPSSHLFSFTSLSLFSSISKTGSPLSLSPPIAAAAVEWRSVAAGIGSFVNRLQPSERAAVPPATGCSHANLKTLEFSWEAIEWVHGHSIGRHWFASFFHCCSDGEQVALHLWAGGDHWSTRAFSFTTCNEDEVTKSRKRIEEATEARKYIYIKLLHDFLQPNWMLLCRS